MAIDFNTIDPTFIAPARRAQGYLSGTHVVDFYENDDALVASVHSFVSSAISTGGAALIVATRVHAGMLTDSLTAEGLDLADLRQRGLFYVADAEATLERFMVDDEPDPLLFTETIGRLISEASLKGSPIKVFGEMVAILWARGNSSAAIRLEELWNLLAKSYSFDLLCAYPAPTLTDQELEELSSICAHHSHVMPPRH